MLPEHLLTAWVSQSENKKSPTSRGRWGNSFINYKEGKNMSLYALYLRKSRSDDPEKSVEETLRRHREILDKYAIENGIDVKPEDIYEEVVSGESLYSRPEMLRLLESVESGAYEGVLCMDIDRLGRGKTSDQGIILETFKYSNTKIITPNRQYDLNDEFDEDYAEFEGFMAHRELKMIKRRMQRGIQKTIEEGGYLANAPYGYVSAKIGKRPSLAINEDEAPFVRMIFDLYVNKGMGCQHIADTINSMGAKPHRSQEFGRTSIMKIIKSPVYIGKIVWNQKTHIRKGTRGNTKHETIYNPPEKWTIVDGLHPAIIDEALYNRAQEIARTKYHSPSFTGVIENPLSGLIHCGNCNRMMTRAPHMRGGPYLLCARRGCIPSSKLPLVEDAVLMSLRNEITRLKGQQEQECEEKQELSVTATKAIDKELKATKEQLSRLHDLLEQQIYDVATFMERRSTLTKKIEKLEAAKASYQKQEKQLNIPAMIQRIELVLMQYRQCRPQEQNELLKSVIEKVIYHKEKGAKPADFKLEISLLPI